MRGKVAKRIRKEVYGDRAPRARKYIQGKFGECVADQWRVMYQTAKRMWTRRHVL